MQLKLLLSLFIVSVAGCARQPEKVPLDKAILGSWRTVNASNPGVLTYSADGTSLAKTLVGNFKGYWKPGDETHIKEWTFVLAENEAKPTEVKIEGDHMTQNDGKSVTEYERVVTPTP